MPEALSALRAGLCLAPMAVGASLVGRRLVGRFGIRAPILGCAITAVSMVVAAVALQVLGSRITATWLVTSLALTGAVTRGTGCR